MNNLSLEARLAIATVMASDAKETTEDLRSKLFDEMEAEWQETKSDRRPILFDGVSRTGNAVSMKAGTISLTMSKAHWATEDPDALMAYCREAGYMEINVQIDPSRGEEAAAILRAAGFSGFTATEEVSPRLYAVLGEGDPVNMETGELVPGLTWVNEKPKGLRVTGGRGENALDKRVDQILHILGESTISGLLKGGEDA